MVLLVEMMALCLDLMEVVLALLKRGQAGTAFHIVLVSTKTLQNATKLCLEVLPHGLEKPFPYYNHDG